MGEINNTVMRLFCIIMLSFLGYGMPLQAEGTSDNPSDREYWVETMDQIARPWVDPRTSDENPNMSATGTSAVTVESAPSCPISRMVPRRWLIRLTAPPM